MSWGINDVDSMIFPEASCRRRGNRDSALLLLLHEVRRGGTVVHLSGLVDLTGELQDPLRGSRLAGIDVREDPDVSVFGKVTHLPVG